MKKTLKKIAAVFAASLALSVAFISCSESDDNTENTQENPENPETPDTPVDDPVVEAAIAKIIIPETVEKSCTLVLPSSVAVEEKNVTVAWSSSDASVISTAGAVTPKAGNEEDTVKLTAVFIFEGKTYSKTYTVKVWQTGKAVIKAALDQVSVEYTPASYAYQTVSVSSSVTVGGQNVSVAYTSSDERAVEPNSANSVLWITKDLVEKEVTLTATVSYNGASASKEFTLTVPACTEFEGVYENGNSKTVSFDMENMEFTAEHKNSGSSDVTSKKYSFEFTEEPGQLAVTCIAVKGESFCEDKDKWYTKEDLIELYGGMVAALAELEKDPPETYEALIAALEPMGLEEGYIGEFMDMLGIEPSEKDTPEQEKANCAAFLTGLIQMALQQACVDTVEEYTEVVVNQMLGVADGDVFGYRVLNADYSNDTKYPTGADIFIQAVYDGDKSWFDQCGNYKLYSSEAGGNNILRCRDRGDVEITWKNSDVKGSFNGDYTEFTSEDGVKYSITDNKDGTVTVSESDSGTSVTLEFEGKSTL